jgi:hypothetical protein
MTMVLMTHMMLWVILVCTLAALLKSKSASPGTYLMAAVFLLGIAMLRSAKYVSPITYITVNNPPATVTESPE